MLSFDRLSDDSGCIELDFLEREATPEPAMRLGIRLHLAGLSLSDTVSILERLGVDRHRTPFIGGYRKLIYSRQTVLIRITLRSMKP
jgi:hypothetical protein